MKSQEPNQIPPRIKRLLFYRKRLRFAIFRRDGFRCCYCNRIVKDGAVLTLEHIVPLSKGGTWSADNLLTACESCNQGKADSLLSATEMEMFKSPGLLFANWTAKGVMLV